MKMMKKAIIMGCMKLVLLTHTYGFCVENKSCIAYEPKDVVLKGIIKQAVFPGPPNYVSAKQGEKPEKYWVLYIKKEICVADGSAYDEDNVAEENVKAIQLIINNYKKYAKYLGKRVVVKGKLSYAITGRHHTPVMLTVEEIQ